MDAPPRGRVSALWIIAGGVLLALAYAPSLGTRFDFTDDGNLVYPEPPMPLPARVATGWAKVASNFVDLGPFRPVLWLHWEVAADLFQGSEFAWRASRMLWCAFAASALLWLLAELGLPWLACLAAGAVAMWGPYRNEIWTSLTLSEGIAMPYAILALVFARKAASSSRPLGWDLAGAACVLAALGCKNTFAALVPAQAFLRICTDGVSLAEGWRRNGRRAVLLCLTLLVPLAHFAYFKLNPHPTHYKPGMPTVVGVLGFLSALRGAAALEWVGAGLALSLVAQLASRTEAGGVRAWAMELASRHRAALGAAALLVAAGVAVYLPMNAVAGRYTMPAAWGLDILFAVAISGLFALPASRLRLAAGAALGLGIAVVLVTSVGKQQKFAARAEMLWTALQWVEANAPRDAVVGWVCGDPARGGLDREEGIHFQWHLNARGRPNTRVALIDTEGRHLAGHKTATLHEPSIRVWGTNGPRCAVGWREAARPTVAYWGGLRSFGCRVGG